MVSPGTKLEARELKTTYRPSALMELTPLAWWFASVPSLATLTRVVSPAAAALLPASTHRSIKAANTVNAAK